MTKEKFFELPDNKRRELVMTSLVNLIMLEDLAPNVSSYLIKKDNYEVIKIVLGAYMNGVIN